MSMSDQTTGTGYAIDHQLSNFHRHTNAKCIVCGALEAEMVRVGAIILCNDCVAIFETDDPVRKEREMYLKWLHKSHAEEAE